MKRRIRTPFDGPVIPYGAYICFNPFSTEDIRSSSSIWYKDASRNILRMRAEFWRRLDRRLDHCGLPALRTSSRQKFTSKDSSPKKLESRNWRKHSYFPFADGFLMLEGHARRQTLRHQRVESFEEGGVPSTLGEAGGDSLQEEGGSCRCS